MNTKYYTVHGYGCTEIEINKSRFIAYVNRVVTEEEALAFIETIRKRHWDATHNCSAYVIGDNDQHQKSSDDGEPSGTAGKPILEIIKKMSLKDTVVVVTRYFGGIKLGAGGLVRAYGKSAVAGLEAAGIIERQLHTLLAVQIEYSLLGTVENNLRNHHFLIADKQFDAAVTVFALAPSGQEAVLEAKLADWTSGQAQVERLGEQYVDIPVS
mgnify:FL=1